MNRRPGPGAKRLPRGLAILYEDLDILVVDKPAGLLTMGTETEQSRTAYFALTDYVRKGCAKSRTRIFIVHRLDRDTSGVLVFAKTEAAKRHLQDHWDETKKTYLAVVHGRCEKASDTITSYLAENTAHVVYSTTDQKRGKLARTAYTVIKQTDNFSLLEIALLTGIKNQIRVHLADIGHPVVGDRKYGKKEDKTHKRLALHAKTISFTHPFHGRPLAFSAPAPAYFNALISGVVDTDGQSARNHHKGKFRRGQSRR